MSVMVFRDRHEAGRRLAAKLLDLPLESPIIVALPRGGVPVAVEVARALEAPLDVLAVRKIGATGHPEYAIGAVAEDGTGVLNADAARAAGMDQRDVERALEQESPELARRVATYRDGHTPIDVRDRTVIVVDDGLATGLTDLVAVRALRARGATRIVVAAPVGSQEAVAELQDEADDVVCVTVPPRFRAVGLWYDDFRAVEDAEVLALLAEARHAEGDPPPDTGPQPPAMTTARRELVFELDDVQLPGDLAVPAEAHGLIIFAHGSGSSRHSSRNQAVARSLQRAGFATLLFDLLADHEAHRRELVFDIPRLARRLGAVARWALRDPDLRALPLGLFGASTGAAAALWAAAGLGDAVRAVVSRGGRPDLAMRWLPEVRSPTLLIVGGADPEVLALNRRAAELMVAPHRIAVVPGAGHLFEEPGALEEVERLATAWFEACLVLEEPLASTGGAR